MMAGVGGYQKPGSPAPVSGMGAQSQRTDGGPADKQRLRYIANLPYGEGQEFMDIQSGAPMEASPAPTSTGARRAVASTGGGGGIIPLTAPSMRPNEPVTNGAELGAGAGLEALGIEAARQEQDRAFAAQIAQYMPVLMQVAASPNTSSETRDVIRQLRNLL